MPKNAFIGTWSANGRHPDHGRFGAAVQSGILAPAQQGEETTAMGQNLLPAFLQIISAAVTPVVMLSACSALILGINAKHTGLSDRIRQAAGEFREPAASAARRAQLAHEIAVFQRRFTLAWRAAWLLYGAVILFILTTLVIVLQQNGPRPLAAAPVTLFVLGVALMLGASCLELAELSLAARTMSAELDDILTADRSPMADPNQRG